MNRSLEVVTARIEPEMVTRGFKQKRSDGTFTKRDAFGSIRVIFPTSRFHDEQVLDAILEVRHDRIEDIVNGLGGIWGDANRAQTATVFRSMKRFPFDSERDGAKVIPIVGIEAVAVLAGDAINAMLLSDGFAFLDRYSSLLECSRGLNDPIASDRHELHYRFQTRAYRGVAAAGLAEPERVPSLIEAYRDFAKKGGVVDTLPFEVGRGLPILDAFAKRLDFVAEKARAALH